MTSHVLFDSLSIRSLTAIILLRRLLASLGLIGLAAANATEGTGRTVDLPPGEATTASRQSGESSGAPRLPAMPPTRRADAAKQSDETAKINSDAVILSPFQVNADHDVGYLAGNSVSGSRFNTRLKDISAQVAVFTPELIMGAELLADAYYTAFLLAGE